MLLLTALLLTACAHEPAVNREEPHTLPLWTVSDGDSLITLIGSIHVLSKADHPLPKPLTEAVHRAGKLYLEFDPILAADPAHKRAVERATIYPDSDRLSRHITTQTFLRLATIAKKFDIPRSELERHPAWYWYLRLPYDWSPQYGYYPKLGVDLTLLKLAQQRNIPVRGLENRLMVFELFNSIADHQAEKLLVQLLNDFDEGEKALTDMTQLWRSGDLPALQRWWEAHNPNFATSEHDTFQDTVIGTRNQLWLPSFTQALANNENAVFVVGLGHMLSDDSLLKLLEKKGYTITQFTRGGL